MEKLKEHIENMEEIFYLINKEKDFDEFKIISEELVLQRKMIEAIDEELVLQRKMLEEIYQKLGQGKTNGCEERQSSPLNNSANNKSAAEDEAREAIAYFMKKYNQGDLVNGIKVGLSKEDYNSRSLKNVDELAKFKQEGEEFSIVLVERNSRESYFIWPAKLKEEKNLYYLLPKHSVNKILNGTGYIKDNVVKEAYICFFDFLNDNLLDGKPGSRLLKPALVRKTEKGYVLYRKGKIELL